jgi:hypothetical protein
MTKKLTNWQFNEELTQHIKSTNPTHWLTIHWHSSRVPREKVFYDLRYLHGVVDSARLGSRFHKKPLEIRSKAVFIIEKEEKSTHSHSFWYVEREVGKFESLFSSKRPEFWKKVAKKCEIDLQPYDPSRGAVKYSLKEFFLETPAENIILTSEFLQKTK